MEYDLTKKATKERLEEFAGELKEISGEEYDQYYKEARAFVDRIKKIIEENESLKK